VQPAELYKFKTPKGEVPILDAPTRAHYLRERIKDLEKCEYFVPVQWLQTVDVVNAWRG
jgi:hypothetical protein